MADLRQMVVQQELLSKQLQKELQDAMAEQKQMAAQQLLVAQQATQALQATQTKVEAALNAQKQQLGLAIAEQEAKVNQTIVAHQAKTEEVLTNQGEEIKRGQADVMTQLATMMEMMRTQSKRSLDDSKEEVQASSKPRTAGQP